ncbi:unnamed protein product [Boreogadus saida]
MVLSATDQHLGNYISRQSSSEDIDTLINSPSNTPNFPAVLTRSFFELQCSMDQHLQPACFTPSSLKLPTLLPAPCLTPGRLPMNPATLQLQSCLGVLLLGDVQQLSNPNSSFRK